MQALGIFDKMAIPRRVRVGFIMMLIVVFLVGGAGLFFMLWIGSWQPQYHAAATQIQAADDVSDAIETISAAAGSLNSVTAKEDYSIVKAGTNIEIGRAEAQKAIETALATEDPGTGDAQALENMLGLLDEYYQAAKTLVAVAEDDPSQIANTSGDTATSREPLEAAATAYEESANAQQVTILDELESSTRVLLIVMAILLAGAVILGVTLATRISGKISNHLNEAVSSVSSSAAELLAVSSQVAAGAAQTAASTNETTATVEEVKQTAQLAQEKASQVAESSENVARVAETGRATVEETISGIERMQNQMTAVVETINRLGEQTRAVDEIITSVNDIAEQSNLLSVNASIEAAKAGEHGKGFNVVAQEVKSLAEQSKQAVSQVRTILGEIQKASRSAVEAAEQGREAIETGRQQSLESGEAIHALAEGATEAAQSAVQISASSRQQLAGMEQISQAIESISQAGNQAVSGTRQVEQEVKNLRDLALSLRRLVDTKATA